MEGVSPVTGSQRRLAFWAVEVTYLHRATRLMLTAYAKVLRAERSAAEDNNSMTVQLSLHYHKTGFKVCKCTRAKPFLCREHLAACSDLKLGCILCQCTGTLCVLAGMCRVNIRLYRHMSEQYVLLYTFAFVWARLCECLSVCGILWNASMCHISHGTLSAGPGGGPLRFMKCHSVAAAMNQVNVADPISSVVLRSRWKNNIWTAWFGPSERLMPV